jgi:hypothetical protein
MSDRPAILRHELLSVSDAEKYGGQYIAIASMEDRKVVASGKDPGVVLDDAASRGAGHPILVYVPEKGVGLLFPVGAGMPCPAKAVSLSS